VAERLLRWWGEPSFLEKRRMAIGERLKQQSLLEFRCADPKDALNCDVLTCGKNSWSSGIALPLCTIVSKLALPKSVKSLRSGKVICNGCLRSSGSLQFQFSISLKFSRRRILLILHDSSLKVKIIKKKTSPKSLNYFHTPLSIE